LQYTLGIGLAVGLLTYALMELDWEQAVKEMQGVNWLMLLLSLVAGLTSHVLRGYRWSMLLKAAQSPVPPSNAFAATLLGYGVNNIVPRLGEVARFGILVRTDNLKIAAGAGTVVTERSIDMLTALLMVGFMFLFEMDTLLNLFAEQGLKQPLSGVASTWLLVLLVLVGLLGLYVFYRYHQFFLRFKLYEKVYGFVRQVLEAVLSIRHLERAGLFVFYSIGIWAMYVTMWYFMLQAFPLTAGLNFYFAFLLTNFGTLAMLLPAPGGAGTFQIASAYMFMAFGAPYGMGYEDGLLLGTLAHLPHYVLNTLVGGLGYLYLLFKTPKRPYSEAEAALDDLD